MIKRLKMLKRFIPRHLRFLFLVYCLGILFFGLFRVLLFVVEQRQLANIPPRSLGLILQAFFIGFRFDTVITNYILSLPALVLSVLAVIGIQSRIVNRALCVWMGFLFTGAFAICAADIPFFGYFFHRITWTITKWVGYPKMVLGIIFGEARYAVYTIPFALLAFALWFLLFKSMRLILDRETGPYRAQRWRSKLWVATLSLVACFLIFLGIRGRTAWKSPITVGTAFFSEYTYLNQLGLNSVYSFFISYLTEANQRSKRVEFMDLEKALQIAKQELGVPDSTGFASPIARKVVPEGPPVQANVVVIIMESMTTGRLARFGCPDSLTPCLDSLADISVIFENAYNAGSHTYNGAYSTLFSYPTILAQHPFHMGAMVPYQGIVHSLKERGYYTIYFTTHDDQFDNVGGFLRANGFCRVVSQQDYPSGEVVSTLGVPDHFMFEFGIPILNQLHAKGRLFFATFRTASDHGPYHVPKNIPFKPRNKNIRKAIVEYADWSIRHFLDLASQQPWSPNTIYAFVSDHGVNLRSVYDLPLLLVHTPMMFHGPGLLESRTVHDMAGQIDIMPTIMGILNVPYVNNTLGIDLFRQKRPFAYFTTETRVGCINQDYYLILREDEQELLHRYRDSDVTNYRRREPRIADRMKEYVSTMLQTTQWLIDNKKVSVVGLENSN